MDEEEIAQLELMDRIRREEEKDKEYLSSKANVGSSTCDSVYKINPQTKRWDLSD